MRESLRRLKPWLFAIVWAGAISGASIDAFSSAHTSTFILPILRWLFPHASAATLALLHLCVRKTAHLTEYFVFGILLFRALRRERGGWQLRWAIAAVAMATVYAALDEFHQSFVPSRQASGWDSLLDTFGVAAAQIVLWLWYRARSRRDALDPVSPSIPD